MITDRIRLRSVLLPLLIIYLQDRQVITIITNLVLLLFLVFIFLWQSQEQLQVRGTVTNKDGDEEKKKRRKMIRVE